MLRRHVAAATGLVLVGLAATTAAPAVAAAAAKPQCTPRTELGIDTPGLFDNTVLKDVQVCIETDDPPSGKYLASVLGFYTDGGDGGGDGKFDDLRVIVRIEQDGRIQAVRTCNLTREVNGSSSGSLQCQVEGVPVGGGPVTADGVIGYDARADGKDDRHFDLHGSPGIP